MAEIYGGFLCLFSLLLLVETYLSAGTSFLRSKNNIAISSTVTRPEMQNPHQSVPICKKEKI